MKVNVEVDCTPLEARQFFGLPDVQPMQTAVMDKMQQQMMANIEKVSPESLIQSWFTFDPKIAERFQDMFVTMAGRDKGPVRTEFEPVAVAFAVARAEGRRAPGAGAAGLSRQRSFDVADASLSARARLRRPRVEDGPQSRRRRIQARGVARPAAAHS